MVAVLHACGALLCVAIACRFAAAPLQRTRIPGLLAASSGAGWFLLGLVRSLVPGPEARLVCDLVSPLFIVPTFWMTMLFMVSQIGVFPDRRQPVAIGLVGAWTVFLLVLHVVPDLRFLFMEITHRVGETGAVEWTRTKGLLYPAVAVLNLSVYCVVVGLCVRAALRGGGLYRRQALGMLAGTLVAMAAYAVQAVVDVDESRVDPMLLAFLPAVMIFSWLSARQGLLATARISRHTLIDAMPAAVMVVGPNGRILEANRAACRLCAEDPDPIGRPLGTFPGLEAAVAGRLGQGALSADVRIAAPGAKEARDYALAVTPFDVGKGDVGHLLTLQDVTERLRLERALTEAHAELSARFAENVRLQGRLEALVRHDGLTGLLNRYSCNEQYPGLLAEAARTGRPLAVVLIDVDAFKAVNDELGHPAGDLALRRIAEVLAAGVAPGGFAYRYGGEEFLLLLPDTAPAAALALTDAMRRRVEAATAATAGLERCVSFSAGVAVCPEESLDWARLVSRADARLYHAKRTGRRRTVVADPDPGAADASPLSRRRKA